MKRLIIAFTLAVLVALGEDAAPKKETAEKPPVLQPADREPYLKAALRYAQLKAELMEAEKQANQLGSDLLAKCGAWGIGEDREKNIQCGTEKKSAPVGAAKK